MTLWLDLEFSFVYWEFDWLWVDSIYDDICSLGTPLPGFTTGNIYFVAQYVPYYLRIYENEKQIKNTPCFVMSCELISSVRDKISQVLIVPQ